MPNICGENKHQIGYQYWLLCEFQYWLIGLLAKSLIGTSLYNTKEEITTHLVTLK